MENSSEEFPRTPREVDLFAEEAMEEILDTIDNLRAQIEQLQIQYEKLATDKAKVDQALIDKESEHQAVKEKLQEDIAYLRKINLQLVASQNTSSEASLDPSTTNWIALDAEKAYKEKVESEKKLEVLQLNVLEKDKYISSLEWQLGDTEATLISVQADRDRLALELDFALAREHEDLQALGAVGDIPHSDSLKHFDYGLVESGYVDDMPVRRIKKQPRRHLSDLTKRGNSYMEDFGGLFVGNASLSDYDVPTSTESEGFGLGRLKRATNFNNINDLDECEKFDNQQTQTVHSDTEGWENFDDADEDMSKMSQKRWDRYDEWQGHKHSEEAVTDIWSFTPDSILNVSTGEELSTLPGADVVTIPSKVIGSENDETKDQQVPVHKTMEKENVGVHSRAEHDVEHQDIVALQKHSKSSSDKAVPRKLEEYQRWKVSGCKGDPPAKLKISQC